MAKTDKPNILIIWGDDIGWFNVSANNNGIMGYRTPNIDRIAKEGCNFTDWYGQQSCTAGRAAFITGQSPIRTGLTKVGLPGADLGLQPEDPTIADVLKPLGYVTGQFGKNHLGDRDEFLPTAHGFDEFFGNLYHLNAEQEPENPDYPKDPEFKKKFGPRGVLHSWANADGTQKIENTGPLTVKRMETVDEEFLDASLKFMEKAVKDDKPFFVLVELDADAHLHAPEEGVGREDGSGHLSRRHGRARRPRRQAARQARSARHRRQHHRHVLDRQRRRGHELARRRHDAVPRREGHELRGRLARALRDSLAGRDQAGHRVERDLLAHRHAADPGRRRAASRTPSRSSRRATSRATRRSRSTSTATTCCRSSKARSRRIRARDSSTGAMTAT